MLKLTGKNLTITGENKKRFVFKVLFLLPLILFGIFTSQNAQAATSYFSPSSGNFTVGNVFTVNILVNTEGATINNAEAVINFPGDLLEVISVSKSGSIFSLWVEEPTFSNSAGSISLNGGLPTPGFNGAAGKILSAVFRVKKGGLASLVFSSAAVRANDGYGTNVFRAGIQASFNLISEEKPLPPAGELPPAHIIGGGISAPQVSSPTHPDQNKWYAKKNAKFTWLVPPDATGVRLLVDNVLRATPTVVYTSAIGEKELTNMADGVWYLHAQFRSASGWGEVTHFRFQIDTQPPVHFSIEFVHGKKIIDPSPIIAFNTSDELSGISYYKVKIGSGAFFEVDPNLIVSNPYALPPQAPGKNTVVVQAYDKAGNVASAVEEFEILALEAPKITRYQENIAEGDLLEIGGKTYPDSDVDLFLLQENKKILEQRVKSNSSGDFTFIWSQKLASGIYEVQAQVTDNRGAKSLPSEKITIVVAKSAIFRIGTWAISLLAVVVPLVLLIITLLFIIWYGWHKFSLMRKRLRKEVREVESTLQKAFDFLKEDIRKQVKMLEKTRTKRELTEEEEKVIAQLKQHLDEAEKFVRKKIEDIEKVA